MCSHINVGSEIDLTIREHAEKIATIVGYQGNIEFDTTKPDGIPRKLLDSSRLNALGWQPKIGLADGLAAAYEGFLGSENSVLP
jgi:GDP-L-fucose synthase